MFKILLEGISLAALYCSTCMQIGAGRKSSWQLQWLSAGWRETCLGTTTMC